MRYVVPLIGIVVGSILGTSLFAQSVSERMVGRILLQVEERGEAWYVNPSNRKRIFMGRPSDAFRIMRELGVGITDVNLERIPVGMTGQGGADQDADRLADVMEVSLGTDFLLADTDADGYDDRTEILAGYDPLKGNGARLSFDLAFTAKQAGRILLQVERNGEAWYVNPADQKRYFLGRPTDAFAVMRATGVGISNKNIDTIQIDTAYVTRASFPKFESDIAFDAYIVDLQKKQKADTVQESAGQYFSAETAETSSPTSSESSITNVQEQGVDEGDIVKAWNDYLVVLRRGRLFTVRLSDGAKAELRPVGQIDVPRDPGRDNSRDNAWYDEMLISNSTVIVIGYNYGQSATEINLFTLASDGSLARGATYFVDSGDYYSSRNYTSRLIGDKLVFYLPYYPKWYALEEQDAIIPSMRHWKDQDTFSEPMPLLKKTQIVKPIQEVPYPTLHTVAFCTVTAELACTGTAILGPSARNFYVSQTAVYLWVAEEGQAFSYRMDLASGTVSGIRVDGSPTDQFSFQEKDNELRVLVADDGDGEAMWNAEKQKRGGLALLRIPLEQFSDDAPLVSKGAFVPLPGTAISGFQNRFVGDMVLYGHTPWLTDGPSTLYVKNVASDDPAVALSLPHGIDRIDALGNDAIVVGRDTESNEYGAALKLSSIGLSGTVHVDDTVTVPAIGEAESRSHGFYFHETANGEGIIGLPVLQMNTSDERPYGRAAVMFARRTKNNVLSVLGELAGSASAEKINDECIASCIDWYGNARPIFYRDRMFALLGYELIEGAFHFETVAEKRRTTYIETLCGFLGDKPCALVKKSGMANGCMASLRPQAYPSLPIFFYETNPSDPETLSGIKPDMPRCALDKDPQRWDVAEWSGYQRTQILASKADPDQCFDEYRPLYHGEYELYPHYAIYTKKSPVSGDAPTICLP